MQSLFGWLASFWVIIVVILSLVFYKVIFRIFLGGLIIPSDKAGVVTKKFVLLGEHKTLPDGRIVALNGEAGLQADTLAPGLHLWFWVWQYRVDYVDFVKIPENQIGVVEARDGNPLPAGRVLARKVECDSFQDARKFLTNDGERGPQTAIIPPGTYRINTELFSIETSDVLEIQDNMVGIVTTKEGLPLAAGEIAGRAVEGHNMFQDGQAFLDGGGYKGLQEQVMLAGRYFLNPNFVTVEPIKMLDVPIANVGVVISYVGATGVDVTGDSFKHGNLVSKGQKGVWVEPLDPGKYPINTYTTRVELVPTANVVLNWATGKTEAHNLDKNLSTITVRSSDGFKFNLDVSQIIHIPRTDAPKVIARFGSVANLVTQVLEPTIGNYFRNAAQGSDAIDFLKQRQQRQSEAKTAIDAALKEYNVGAVDTLIGDIVPPDELMKTLTDRKIAEQERITYETQRQAEGVRKELQQAKALADTQARVVDAERKVQIAEFEANAQIKTAEGDAKSKTINAEADAAVLTMVGDATGKQITAVGQAEADVLKRKGEAINPNNFALIEVAKALSTSGFKLVPDVVAGGGTDDNGSLVNVLLANLITNDMRKGEENGKRQVDELVKTK